MSVINIVLGEKYFKKDPQSSNLGRRIVHDGVIVLDELGFEEFTFKKLAERIDSSEASVYRYFRNKHKFLVYLSTYYWSWLEYAIEFETHHIDDPKERLEKIIMIVCHAHDFPKTLEIPDVNISRLRKVIDNESDKTYLNRDVDVINSKGLFKGYKSLCSKISEVVHEISPEYGHAKTLVSMIMEAAHQQVFFAQHLPSLTNISLEKDLSLEYQTAYFLRDTTIKLLN